ncbi:hypothetical protein KP79_PYT23101 [Mizuhopecten yessoensis]|uniref:Uncharacterized protein n=1 Tax=Mizuhopecten yessoensis TaxID=6573 RepID=A0A210R3I3_MIZYE|nr:hypothetical protein KP79_PYT23101 [Mizuhopecten yessoensis]
MSSTEGSGAYVTQGVYMETTASDIPTTAPSSTSSTYAETSTLIDLISETMSSTMPADTQSTESTSQDCCVCVNNTTKTGRIWTLQELRELTRINKKNTSIAIRKLTSAKDDRMSAIGLGYCGIAVLFTVLASIVSIDLSRYLCKNSKVSPRKQNCP